MTADKVEYSFHDVCFLFPEMSDQQIGELAEHIKANGQLVPIVTYQGKIIDGRHRYIACGRVGVTPTYREWDGHGSMTEYVIGLNKQRRHMTPSQLAMLAAKAKPLFEAEAEARQQSTLKQNAAKNAGKSPLPSRGGNGAKGTAAAAAAKSVGASETSVERAVKVLESGDEELVKAVETGKVTVKEAARRVGDKSSAKSTPKNPDVIKDGLGNPVPDKYLDHFTTGIEKFNQFRKLMLEASKLVGELAEDPWGVFIHAQSVKSDLANAKRGVGQAEPLTICPFCKGKQCSACRDSGIATKLLWDKRDKGEE